MMWQLSRQFLSKHQLSKKKYLKNSKSLKSPMKQETSSNNAYSTRKIFDTSTKVTKVEQAKEYPTILFLKKKQVLAETRTPDRRM